LPGKTSKNKQFLILLCCNIEEQTFLRFASVILQCYFRVWCYFIIIIFIQVAFASRHC